MKTKASKAVKIDWDTVELVGELAPVLPVPVEYTPLFPGRRGRLGVKQILSGAAAKARARGAIYTHAQLRKLLPVGLETLIYGWQLVLAAMESDRNFARAVEMAAQVIHETSHRVLHR